MLPTLTQLPTSKDDDKHTNNIRYRRSEKICLEISTNLLKI